LINRLDADGGLVRPEQPEEWSQTLPKDGMPDAVGALNADSRALRALSFALSAGGRT
jgi:hypothetical protein